MKTNRIYFLIADQNLIIDGKTYFKGEAIKRGNKIRFWRTYDGVTNYARELFGFEWPKLLVIGG